MLPRAFRVEELQDVDVQATEVGHDDKTRDHGDAIAEVAAVNNAVEEVAIAAAAAEVSAPAPEAIVTPAKEAGSPAAAVSAPVIEIGTPEEVYSHPASRFVAEFVTQANFLPARRQGNIWQTEIGDFEIDSKRDRDTGEIMIRQEDLILNPDTNAKVKITKRRFLGREYRYCLETASGREIHARTMTDTVLPEGISVKLSIVDNAVKVFSE